MKMQLKNPTPQSIKIHRYGPYRIGSRLDLSQGQVKLLAGRFQRPPQAAASVLGGRRSPGVVDIPELGPAVIKHYRRGGLLRRLNKQRYLGLGKPRCRIEFELLETVGSLGINVPRPLAYAVRGRWVYRAWLVTGNIENQGTLAEACLKSPDLARQAMGLFGDQLRVLIDNGVLHVDLHPGNVILGKNGRVYILDFDKGRRFSGSRAKLKKRYLSRWQRAVAKHRLPDMLAETLAANL